MVMNLLFSLSSISLQKSLFVIQYYHKTDYYFFLLIKRCLWMAGGSSISQLVADHMSFSESKLGVITDTAPLIFVVDLDTSRGIWGGGVSMAPQPNHSIARWSWRRHFTHLRKTVMITSPQCILNLHDCGPENLHTDTSAARLVTS